MMIEKDDFWNIDRILPKNNTVYKKTNNVDTIDVTTNTAPTKSGVDVRALFSAVNEKKSINSVESAIEKEREYEHFSDSRIISYAYVGKYSNALTYDNRTRSHALSLFESKPTGTPEFIEFFSFKPSFSELTESQLNYYLYWRENVRQGNFLETSSSYVFLLICEIVNLPDKIPPSDGIDLIITLFDKCIGDISRHEKIVSDLLFEYCVVHNLPIPYEKIQPIIYKFKNPISTVIGSLFVFDYLFSKSMDFSENELRFIFEQNLNFSFSTGKHYASNNKLATLLDKYFYKVLGVFIKEVPSCISQIYERRENRSSPVKVIRPTYLLLNVSSEIKKNIIFEYYSFEKSDVELLYLLNIAKSIENKFRAMCGIRARLTVTSLDDNSKRVLDGIFEKLLPSKRELTQTRNTVETKKVSINVDAAQKIEEASWETTKMLTDGIEIFDDSEPAEDVPSEESSFLTEFEKNVLRSVLNNDTSSVKAECESKGLFFDAVVLTINEKALEYFGDVIIDTETVTVFDDYTCDVLEFLK